MSDYQKQLYRGLYNELRERALQPGEYLAPVWFEYRADVRRLEVKRDRLQKWRAA